MKNKIRLLVSIVTISLLTGCSENIELPSYLQDYKKEYHENPRAANLEWFTHAKYGMFIHYGLYSLLEKGEWVQLRDTIPVSEYARLKDQFTASNFNADEITRLAVDAGMKYITITSKHHDGFCLFNTEATDYNVLQSPAKRDLIKELYDACEKKGLGLFLYYSYGADWHHPFFYSRESGWPNARPAYKVTQSEYKFEKDEDFNIYVHYVHQQLKEIFTQYPNIAGIWFDPILGYYSRPDLFPVDSTYALIRKLSPHALISFKQGANGDEDFMAPERGGSARVGQQFEVAKTAYEKNINKPREICNTLQPHSWGYNKQHDGNHKTADDIIKMVHDANKANANLLLNIGPKGDGSIPEEDIIALREAGKRLTEKTHNLSQQDTCVVLTGSPLNPDSYHTVKHVLETFLDCYVKEISLETDEIATADLTNVKFLYWAGGPYFRFNPSAAAAANIRQAVAGGMGYFGTCGGSLIAVETTPSSRENQLALFPGRQPFGEGRGMRGYQINLAHPVLKNCSVADSFQEIESIHYNGGGSDFQPSVPGLVNWILATDTIRKTPALTTTLFGRGRVFLSVAHPERSFTPGTWKFVRMAAEWCLGRSDPVDNQKPVINATVSTSGEINHPLSFSASGSTDPEGYPIGFIWDFGDGSDRVYRPVEKHTYTTEGTYTVTLTVTDGMEDAIFTEHIIIRNEID